MHSVTEIFAQNLHYHFCFVASLRKVGTVQITLDLHKMRDFIIHCIYQLDMKQAQILILELRILKALRVLPTKVASWLDEIKFSGPSIGVFMQ